MELFHRLPQVISSVLESVRRDHASLLDVGCWDGEFTTEYARAVEADLSETHGYDFFRRCWKRRGGVGFRRIRLIWRLRNSP